GDCSRPDSLLPSSNGMLTDCGSDEFMRTDGDSCQTARTNDSVAHGSIESFSDHDGVSREHRILRGSLGGDAYSRTAGVACQRQKVRARRLDLLAYRRRSAPTRLSAWLPAGEGNR